MNDVINRKDAIGAILSVGHIAELSDGDAVIRVSAVNYVLRNLPSAQPGWIPLTVKYPETNEDVLLQFPSNQGVGFYENGSWGINTGDGIYSAIGDGEEMPMAWMPLPTPYREGKKNE